MKIHTNKNRIIISVIILVALMALIFIKRRCFVLDGEINFFLFSLSLIISIASCILFAIKLETNSKANIIISTISFLVSILLSYIIAELLNKNILFNLSAKRLIFNFIVIVFLHLFIYSLSNRINLSIILSNSIFFIIGLINYVIVCFRGTPFVPWDILSIKTAASVAGAYTFEFSYHLLLAITLLAFVIAIGLKANYKFKKQKLNLILRSCSALIIIIMTIAFYRTNIINYFDFETDLWEPSTEYAHNGFLASFIKQSKNLFNDKPDNYSASDVENILIGLENEIYTDDNYSVYTSNSISNEDKPNIIVIMNESYSDLTVHGDFETSTEYMAYFKSLTENTIRGNTYVSVFGGQTPNSEWEFLTNNSMAFMPYRTIPYQQYISKKSYSLATTLKSQGYTATAIHPWYGSGYRRNAVYPLLGFDSFESLETLDNLEYLRVYTTDLSTYNYVINHFEEKDEGEKLFEFVVTMQNHSGYDLGGYESTVHLTDIENCPRVEQYLSLIKESDNALEYLINYFENYDEKTIILFFGDHQPPYLEDEFWEAITDESESEATKYITPFILWANYDIEEQYIDKISLNYLSILLLETAGISTTPYMEFLKTIQGNIPVITGNGYIDNNGTYYDFSDENEYSDLLYKYQIVQYNNVFDSKNKVNRFFEVK